MSAMNLHIVHVALRLASSTCLLAFVGIKLYKYYFPGGKCLNDVHKEVAHEQGGENEQVSSNQGESNIDGSDYEPLSDIDEDSTHENNQDESGVYVSDDEGTLIKDVQDIEDISPKNTNNTSNSSDNQKNSVNIYRRKLKKLHDRHGDGPVADFTEEQITDRLRTDLTKQGYKLIETHSAVKMCRWTKNSLRGRGGCYKHTFYGIKSYQCMEMTPNLACASKCTFCWRHHRNPVGTEWKWKMDNPYKIVETAIKEHLKMIKEFRGVPGVKSERITEAQTIRHCALSLVGEPIFYPRINDLLECLHSLRISTFLVTNAQFPDAMRDLIPVTQLYVSIDAPNKEALRKIDRPLYKDFWERYIECLKIVKEKKQRTVYRLTLVRKANMEDIKGYAELIKIGEPDFIELKGVTFCGTSKANKLTMENVPWHEQVVDFTKELTRHLPSDRYRIACEHSHSNCTLIANTKFLIDGKWHTWIDYDRFFELATLPDFTSLDYAAETKSWAIFGSEESGFDPEHQRWRRNEHKKKLYDERVKASMMKSEFAPLIDPQLS